MGLRDLCQCTCIQLDDNNMPVDKLDKTALAVLAGIGCEATTVSVARADPKVHDYIQQGMKLANDSALSRAQKVQVRTYVRIFTVCAVCVL